MSMYSKHVCVYVYMQNVCIYKYIYEFAQDINDLIYI